MKHSEIGKAEIGTRRWKKLRAKIISRDGACVWCGSQENLQVDHITPRVMGGTNAEENLQVLCKICNLKKGKKDPFSAQRGHPPFLFLSKSTQTSVDFELFEAKTEK